MVNIMIFWIWYAYQLETSWSSRPSVMAPDSASLQLVAEPESADAAGSNMYGFSELSISISSPDDDDTSLSLVTSSIYLHNADQQLYIPVEEKSFIYQKFRQTQSIQRQWRTLCTNTIKSNQSPYYYSSIRNEKGLQCRACN